MEKHGIFHSNKYSKVPKSKPNKKCTRILWKKLKTLTDSCKSSK